MVHKAAVCGVSCWHSADCHLSCVAVSWGASNTTGTEALVCVTLQEPCVEVHDGRVGQLLAHALLQVPGHLPGAVFPLLDLHAEKRRHCERGV